MTGTAEPADKRRVLALAIGRCLGLLRVARGKPRRDLAELIGRTDRDLEAIEEGTAEATADDVLAALAALHFGVEDLLAVVVATRGHRRETRIELVLRLTECLGLQRGTRGKPLSEALSVNAIEGLRPGVTWCLLRLLGRFWERVEL